MQLSELKGVGPTRLERLRAVGICSLRDLLCAYPLRYEDRTRVTPCTLAQEGPCGVRGVVVTEPKLQRYSGITKVTATLQDASGKLALAWYNQPWMRQQLPVGEEITLWGRLSARNGRRVLQNAAIVTDARILPVYRAVPGLPAKTYRGMVEQALQALPACCAEHLPESFRARHGLMERTEAIREAHQPTDLVRLGEARRRLAFEEALMYQAALGLLRNRDGQGMPLPIPQGAEENWWRTLPFPPTGAQRRVLAEVGADLRGGRPMSRLVQGDVGCGKTAIAFGAIALTVEAGFQAAMMAPTEILARQHYESARAQLEPLGIRCGLLLGSMRASEKRAAHQALAAGEWQAVFGTHALISAGVRYQRLGLVITDEQHRFGVRQRSTLQEKGRSEERVPHVLVMSATPIPRTLALILYGDLDVSIVDEMPPGRTPVRTRIVPEEKRRDMYGFLRKEIAAGHQAYVVCPLVEDSEAEESGDLRSARSTFEDLSAGVLHGLRVALTWGGQPPEEKAEVLRAFAAGETDVLVSTTVIEVGVNVPNATVMAVENAERFGLSQLHQLRGRVGRGAAESWCFLLAKANERLRILAESSDGFVIAQKDLELRGPGDLMGTRQAGEMQMGIPLGGDIRLLEEASSAMKRLRADPALQEERRRIEEIALTEYREAVEKVALN